MAFAASNFTSFDPTLLAEPKTPVFGQIETQAFNRLSRDTQLALADVRKDVDDAFGRLGSLGVVNGDDLEPAMFGPYYVAGPIDPGDAADVLKIWGEVRGELSRTAPGVYTKSAPVAASKVVDFTAANSDITFTCRNPGNGTDDYPMGNRILLRFIDTGEVTEALEITNDVVEIDGRKWLCIQVVLQKAVSAVVTTAADIVNACTIGNGSWSAAIGNYLKATAEGGGGGILNAVGVQQLINGVGGLYGVWLGSAGSGGLTWSPMDSWGANFFQTILDGTAYAVGSTVRVVPVVNGIAYPFEVTVSDIDFGIEKAGGSVFVGPDRFIQLSGTYTLTYASNKFLLTRTASAAADGFALPLELEQRSTADKGKILTGFKVVYTVNTADLEDVVPTFYKVPVPADNAAITATAMTFTYDTAHDTNVKRGSDTAAPELHTMTCTLDTPLALNAGEMINAEISVDGDAGPTGAFVFYGIQALFSTEEDY